MNCQEVIDFLSEYLDGTLPWHRRAIFWLHLRLCSECRNYLASFCGTLVLVRTSSRNVSADELPPIPSELVQAIQAARK